jgi:hypothetical protein
MDEPKRHHVKLKNRHRKTNTTNLTHLWDHEKTSLVEAHTRLWLSKAVTSGVGKGEDNSWIEIICSCILLHSLQNYILCFKMTKEEDFVFTKNDRFFEVIYVKYSDLSIAKLIHILKKQIVLHKYVHSVSNRNKPLKTDL